MRRSAILLCVTVLGCSQGIAGDSGALSATFGPQTESATVSATDPTTATGSDDTTAGSQTGDTTGTTDTTTGTDPATTDPTDPDTGTSDGSTTDEPAESSTTAPAVCGDGVAEDAEPCDGNDFADSTCADFGFPGGELVCSEDCTSIDTSMCLVAVCGNGLIEEGEACDGADLDDATCESEGLGTGTIACDPVTCALDTSDCVPESGALVTVRTADAVLRRIDPDTLQITDIGPLGVAFDFGEVAWDSNTDTLWMIDGRPQESLYTVNVGTGQASLVGVHGIEDLFGLAHNTSNGVLYGSGESPTGLYTMNQGNGSASFVGDPLIAADGLAYDSLRDQLVALAGGPGTLFTIDEANAQTVVLSNQGFINNCGLGYDPTNDLLWAIDWSGNLYTYDPNNAYTRTLELSGLGAHDGMTFVPGL